MQDANRTKAEERIAKINNVFLNFSVDSRQNINRLTALCGELLNADCALYNRLEEDMLCSCGQWNVPKGFSPVDNAKGHICYDVIQKGGDKVVVVRNLQDTEYVRTDPNVSLYKLQTYVGSAVKFGEAYIGTLCVVYTRDFVPTDEDKKILGIIASAIGVEEKRRSAEEVNKLSHFSIERAADSIFWIGPNAEILYVNERTCRNLGYSREELARMTVHGIDPNFPKEAWAGHWKELKERGSFTFESKHRRKDGTVFPVEITVNYLEFDGKEYNFAFARDITERKEQEEALTRRDYQLEILSRTSQHINSVLDVPQIIRTLVAAAMELVGATAGMAGILNNDKIVFSEYNRKGKISPINFCFEHDDGVSGIVMASCKPYIANDAAHDRRISPEVQKKLGLYNLINVPILSNKGKLLGCLEIHDKEGYKSFDAQDAFMLQGLAASAAVAIENADILTERKKAEEALAENERKLKQLALKDPHTGLYDHHYLSEVIEAEFSRARRYASPLSVIMLDIDYFKSINEVYGHQFGDLVLKQLAKQLLRMVRRYDTVARFGGEEFVILTPATDAAKATMLAQRLLDALTIYNFGNKKHAVRLKISVAVTSYPEDNAIKGVDLVNLAEEILGKVKEAGGNRVWSSYDIHGGNKDVHKKRETTETRLLKDRLEKLTKKGNQSLMEAIFAFAKTLELKDHYTGSHVENTVHYATNIARALQLSAEDIDLIRKAAVLHDLGKIGISEKILGKKAKLTKKEFEEIKKHPQIGADIIRPIQFLHGIIPLVFYHHERWDGKGYPSGLRGDEIPIGARVIAMADVYQALTSDRPYRKAYSKVVAMRIIKDGSGTQFDPKIVDIFLKILKKRSA